MNIKLAKTAGFCMGVKRAVDMVIDIAQHKGKENIYTYGPLIHNPQTIELLRQRGIIPLIHMADIESCEEGSTIIIRAHGISPQERKKIKEKGIRIIDATCPKVAHVQAIIKKYASLDYTILIVGDGDHPEVNGLLGYACDKGIVIGSKDEVNNLPNLNKVCVVAQTTQSIDEYTVIVDKIMERFPNTTAFDTICDSTEKRQIEVKELANEMDAMFIVGGRNSANTRRLAGLSECEGAPTFHIETADELEKISIDQYDKIGISAGASTPNWIIDRVVDKIASLQRGKKEKISRLLKLWLFAVRTDIYSAVGAGSLSFSSMLLQKLDVNILHVLTASLYVFAMHTLNRFINRKTSSIIGSFREDSYLRNENLYIATAILFLIIALGFAFITGIAPFILLLSISILGVLYDTKLLPLHWRIKSLKDLPGSKNVSTALAWAAVVAAVPQSEINLHITPGMLVAFLFTFSLVFIRSAMTDMLDIQGDRLIGKETIPVLIGREKTQSLLAVVTFLLAALLIISFPAGWTSSSSFALLTCTFYIWICFRLCDRRSLFSGIVLEGFLETSYIVAGASSFIWLIISIFVENNVRRF